MIDLEILDASTPHDRQRWISLWQRWPDREVSAHPDYVQLFLQKGQRGLCVAMIEQDGAVLFPLILRRLSSEQWVPDDYAGVDLITPYGYGGAFAFGKVNAHGYWNAFTDWATKNRVVSCFARLSLFDDQILPSYGAVEVNNLNIVRELKIDEESIWMDLEHKVRKNVKRALLNGVRVQSDKDGKCIDDFLRVYYNTLERRKADELYYFPRSFFENLTRDLPGQFVFFNAILHDKIVSSELVLVSSRYIYSFLGGTDSGAFGSRPNDLLKWNIIQWGREAGKTAFILGGGYQKGDGIFRYKKSFSPAGEVPYKVGKLVLDWEEYDRLVRLRKSFKDSCGEAWDLKEKFFPAYRS